MVKLTIDNREVMVEPGATLLDVARTAGIDVPTLCYCEGLRPNTTCMVCVVKVLHGSATNNAGGNSAFGNNSNPTGKLVPACATRAADGMIVESESDEVRLARKTSLELLLSDHAAECHAPCQFADPFDTDIPRMIRAVAAGRLTAAVAILRDEMPLTGALTRVARETCEGGCRRCAIDDAAAIGLLKRYVADKDRTVATRYVPPRATATGKRVAIVGSGPAGLSAAYFLAQFGHDCTVFEQGGKIGGSLWIHLTGNSRAWGGVHTSGLHNHGGVQTSGLHTSNSHAHTDDELAQSGASHTPASRADLGLSEEVLNAEIALLRCLGVKFELDRQVAPPDLLSSFHAVLIASGKAEQRIKIESATHATATPGLFAAGDAVRPQADAARAAADGKAAAFCVDQYLRDLPITGREKLFALGTGRPSNDEIASLMVDTDKSPRATPADQSGSLTDEQARLEARRCLHCDCRSLATCKLRLYAERYGADAKRFKGARRPMERIVTHPEIVYEPGKCIVCGICVQITEQLRDALGLTYVGRGFDVRVAVPFDERLDAALREAARRCVENCPTGALAWRSDDP